MSSKSKRSMDRISPLDMITVGKYHSCLITGYSFDFLFFEKFVMPKLRNLKISNVNLLIDSTMFKQSIADFNVTSIFLLESSKRIFDSIFFEGPRKPFIEQFEDPESK